MTGEKVDTEWNDAVRVCAGEQNRENDGIKQMVSNPPNTSITLCGTGERGRRQGQLFTPEFINNPMEGSGGRTGLNDNGQGEVQRPERARSSLLYMHNIAVARMDVE